ncbi:MAG: archaeal proteasome endopeptidase complex subunit alpha [Candidatus Ranarchaeia archaeon]
MMQQPSRLGYDKSATLYNPDGRIIQVEYAREAVKRGSTSVGIRVSSGVVLAGISFTPNKLIEPNVKIYTIDENMGALTTGYIADTRQLIHKARVESQVYRLSYQETPDILVIGDSIGDYIQQHTQYAGLRPFGCSLLVAGMSDNAPHLLLADPGGAVLRCKGIAVGTGEEEAREVIEKGYKTNLTLEKTIILAIKALSAGAKKPIDEIDFHLGVLDNKDQKFKLIEEIESYKKKAKASVQAKSKEE